MKKPEFESYLDTLLVLLSVLLQHHSVCVSVLACDSMFKRPWAGLLLSVTALILLIVVPWINPVWKQPAGQTDGPPWLQRSLAARTGARSCMSSQQSWLTKEGFAPLLFLILKGFPNFLLFRERMQHTQGFYSRRHSSVLFFQVFGKCVLERPKLSCTFN